MKMVRMIPTRSKSNYKTVLKQRDGALPRGWANKVGYLKSA